jgi:plastocyanin
MTGKRFLVYALVGVMAMVGLAGCGGGDDDDERAVGLVKTNKFLRFDPDRVPARVGQETTFTLQNDDDKQHNITINEVVTEPELNPISVDVGPKQTRAVRFTIRQQPRQDFLTFFCRFHQSEGMQGRLTLS